MNPPWVTVEAHGKQLKMEIDTGAFVSLISEETYKKMWNRGEERYGNLKHQRKESRPTLMTE